MSFPFTSTPSTSAVLMVNLSHIFKKSMSSLFLICFFRILHDIFIFSRYLMSPLFRILISSILYFIIANLVKPRPKAKPVYLSGSMPPSFNTLGWTIPHGQSSNQPEFLHVGQPTPPHTVHEQSSSNPGSVNGKYPGLSLTLTSSLNTSFSIPSIVYIRLDIEMFSPITIPSNWKNVFSWQASRSSLRKHLPGAHILIGDPYLSIPLTWRALVWVLSSIPFDNQYVSCISLAGWVFGTFKASKL